MTTNTAQVPAFISWTPPSPKTVQRGLMAAAVVTAILSAIPTISLIGTLSLRSVAFLSACNNFVDSCLSKSSYGVTTIKAIKISLAVLSIAAIASGIPVIIVAALAADIALQSFDIFKALYYEKNGKKALFHFLILSIDALALGGLVGGCWPCMIAASALSATAMLVLAVFLARKAKSADEIFDTISYAALGAVGVTGAVTTAEVSHKFAINPHLTSHENPATEATELTESAAGQLGGEAPSEDQLNALPAPVFPSYTPAKGESLWQRLTGMISRK